MDSNQLNGIIRAVVPALLAFAVGDGLITQDTATQIAAAAVAVAAAVWSWYTNKPSQIVAQAAANTSVDKITVTDPALAQLPSPKVVEK